MRKRDLEKLLYDAVAEAIGVDAKTAAKPTRQAAPKARRPQHQPAMHRAAA